MRGRQAVSTVTRHDYRNYVIKFGKQPENVHKSYNIIAANICLVNLINQNLIN